VASIRALPAPVSVDADDVELLKQVASYYHERLKQSPEALDYLKARGLTHPEVASRFQLGFSDRTLGLRLPMKNRQAGMEIRSRLQKLGLLRESARALQWLARHTHCQRRRRGGRDVRAQNNPWPSSGNTLAPVPARATQGRLQQRWLEREQASHPLRGPH
jgi:hypothetical protein